MGEWHHATVAHRYGSPGCAVAGILREGILYHTVAYSAGVGKRVRQARFIMHGRLPLIQYKSFAAQKGAAMSQDYDCTVHGSEKDVLGREPGIRAWVSDRPFAMLTPCWQDDTSATVVDSGRGHPGRTVLLYLVNDSDATAARFIENLIAGHRGTPRRCRGVLRLRGRARRGKEGPNASLPGESTVDCSPTGGRRGLSAFPVARSLLDISMKVCSRFQISLRVQGSQNESLACASGLCEGASWQPEVSQARRASEGRAHGSCASSRSPASRLDPSECLRSRASRPRFPSGGSWEPETAALSAACR
jgi:hypothetical protein